MITCKNDRLFELLWFVGYCIEFPTQLAVRIGGGAGVESQSDVSGDSRGLCGATAGNISGM